MTRRSSREAGRAQERSLYLEGDCWRAVSVSAKLGDARSNFRRDLARLMHAPCIRRLQGKSQLFPSDENDFFRNRLTHSLEVAQIATGVAIDLNAKPEFKRFQIDLDLVQFAALAHDIGHPPFGHNGERALNVLMKDHGGFEGNAQTLRILAKLEKKETYEFPSKSSDFSLFSTGGKDHRLGLNLTARSLASILKYDRLIKANANKLEKGFYKEEDDLVSVIKRNICGDPNFSGMKTIECSIMDLADDIAYSTYDIEDAFKGGFFTAAAMVAISDQTKKKIIDDVNNKMNEAYKGELEANDHLTVAEFNDIIVGVLGKVLSKPNIDLEVLSDEQRMAVQAAYVFSRSCELAEDGYFRADFTSKLVSKMMRGIYFSIDEKRPALSRIRFKKSVFKMVELLKRLASHHVIDSHQLKMAEHRGQEIINLIFNVLVEEKDGIKLLPADWRRVAQDSDNKHRTVCDFIPGMTDRYCIEFYSRLVGINAPSIQKPF